MLETVLLIIGVLIAVVPVLVLRRPDEFRVTRSAVIDAAPQAVFEHVNDLEKWQAWSPWARMDPDAETRFEGPKAGEGATVYWDGKKTGRGGMTVIESRAPSFVRFRLDFVKPMKATNTAEFTFAPEGERTKVTWAMYGPNNFMGKLVGLVMNCEKMVGGQFEDGLKYLNEAAGPRK
jgi:hypothetical protein